MSDDLEASTENRKFNYKVIPLIIIYQLWVVAIVQAFGWLPAIPAALVTGGWISGWPKGTVKNIVFVFLLALVIPIILVVALGIEPNAAPN